MSERLIGPGGGTALGQRRRRLRGRTSHIVCFVARFGVALHLPLLPKRALSLSTTRRNGDSEGTGEAGGRRKPAALPVHVIGRPRGSCECCLA